MKVKRKNQNTAHPFLTEIAVPKGKTKRNKLKGYFIQYSKLHGGISFIARKRAVFYSLNPALNRRFNRPVILINVKYKGILFIISFFSLLIE